MTSIEVFPTPEQELVLDANDWYASINLGDITIYIPGNIPGNSPEKRADWLMGFWENLTDYMANHTDPTHLTEYAQRAANQSGGNK